MTIRQQQQDCELAWVPTHLLGRSQYCRMRFITRFNQKDPRELQEAGLERTGATETLQWARSLPQERLAV